jgi:hypothetical protein
MTRNAGKLLAPLAMGALIVAVPLPLAFALVGGATVATVPVLRPVRRLDPLLAHGDESVERLVTYPISD